MRYLIAAAATGRCRAACRGLHTGQDHPEAWRRQDAAGEGAAAGEIHAAGGWQVVRADCAHAPLDREGPCSGDAAKEVAMASPPDGRHERVVVRTCHRAATFLLL